MRTAHGWSGRWPTWAFPRRIDGGQPKVFEGLSHGVTLGLGPSTSRFDSYALNQSRTVSQAAQAAVCKTA